MYRHVPVQASADRFLLRVPAPVQPVGGWGARRATPFYWSQPTPQAHPSFRWGQGARELCSVMLSNETNETCWPPPPPDLPGSPLQPPSPFFPPPQLPLQPCGTDLAATDSYVVSVVFFSCILLALCTAGIYALHLCKRQAEWRAMANTMHDEELQLFGSAKLTKEVRKVARQAAKLTQDVAAAPLGVVSKVEREISTVPQREHQDPVPALTPASKCPPLTPPCSEMGVTTNSSPTPSLSSTSTVPEPAVRELAPTLPDRGVTTEQSIAVREESESILPDLHARLRQIKATCDRASTLQRNPQQQPGGTSSHQQDVPSRLRRLASLSQGLESVGLERPGLERSLSQASVSSRRSSWSLATMERLRSYDPEAFSERSSRETSRNSSRMADVARTATNTTKAVKQAGVATRERVERLAPIQQLITGRADGRTVQEFREARKGKEWWRAPPKKKKRRS